MVFILPVLIPYYKDAMGLSFHDFFIGEAAFSAVLILFDVPAGYLADRWGRRKVLILGAGLLGTGYLALMMANGFWSAVAAQAYLGMGIATISGAHSALLYDSLLSAGRESEYRKREGFRFALQLYAVTIACVIGGYLYAIHRELPLILSAIIYGAGAIVALFLIEPERHKILQEKHPLKDMRDTIIYVLHGHPEIAAITLMMVIVFSTTKICMWSIQAYAGATGTPELYNGWIVAGAMLLGAVSSQYGHHIFKNTSGRTILFLMALYLAVIMAAAGIINAPWAVAFLCAEAFVFGFAMPRAQEAINKLVDSSMRATVLSSANLCMSLGFIPLSQFLGIVTDSTNMMIGLIYYAVLLAALAVGIRLFTHRRLIMV